MSDNNNHPGRGRLARLRATALLLLRDRAQGEHIRPLTPEEAHAVVVQLDRVPQLEIDARRESRS